MQWNREGGKTYGFSSFDPPYISPSSYKQHQPSYYFKDAMKARVSPVWLFRFMAGLRTTHCTFLHGSLRLGRVGTAQIENIITLSRYPDIKNPSELIFAGLFHHESATVNLTAELNLAKGSLGSVVTMTSNLNRRRRYRVGGTINLSKVKLRSFEGILIKTKGREMKCGTPSGEVKKDISMAAVAIVIIGALLI